MCPAGCSIIQECQRHRAHDIRSSRLVGIGEKVMNTSKHLIRAYELRRVSHPILPEVEKYWLSVRALDFPSGISTKANARDPIGMNRRVYRDVSKSLEGKEHAVPGTFDLMNKGITILAQSVRLVDK